MKKVLNNKLYNTESAVLCGSKTENANDDLTRIDESLYRKKTGEFFLHGVGGPKTRYAKSMENGWQEGEKIIPLTIDAAREWAKEKLTPDEYSKCFDNDKESESRFHFKLPTTLKAEFEKKCKNEGISMGRKLNQLIEEYLDLY